MTFGRKVRADMGENGYVRGWHSGCPAAPGWALGTYRLVPGPNGTVDCEACGATDLAKVER